MDKNFYQKPVPAVALAIGLGVIAGKANANAARALAMPTLIFSGLLALLFAVLIPGAH